MIKDATFSINPSLTNEDLPIIHEALIDSETLDRLFSDVATCAELLEVIPKLTARNFVHPSQISLAEARDMLISQQLRGVQLRYLFEGSQWWDTLLRTSEGVRLIRISHGRNIEQARQPRNNAPET